MKYLKISHVECIYFYIIFYISLNIDWWAQFLFRVPSKPYATLHTEAEKMHRNFAIKWTKLQREGAG